MEQKPTNTNGCYAHDLLLFLMYVTEFFLLSNLFSALCFFQNVLLTAYTSPLDFCSFSSPEASPHFITCVTKFVLMCRCMCTHDDKRKAKIQATWNEWVDHFFSRGTYSNCLMFLLQRMCMAVIWSVCAVKFNRFNHCLNNRHENSSPVYFQHSSCVLYTQLTLKIFVVQFQSWIIVISRSKRTHTYYINIWLEQYRNAWNIYMNTWQPVHIELCARRFYSRPINVL